MMHVDVEAFEADPGHYLAHVREGETLIITQDRVPIARMEPLSIDHLPAKLQELIKSGGATYGGSLRRLPAPIRMTPGEKTSTDFVREQRR